MSKQRDLHVLQGRTAGFVTRLLAYTMDVAILAGVLAVGGWLAVLVDSALESMGVNLRTGVAAIYLFLTPFIIGSYFVFFWVLTGRTIGKWFMGLKVIGRGGEDTHASTSAPEARRIRHLCDRVLGGVSVGRRGR